MTQEYEPISFNKASEAVAFLEDGGKLYQMDAGHAYQVSIPTVASNWPMNGLYTEKKPAPWYERLDGEAVLCYVSDFICEPSDEQRVAAISKVGNEDVFYCTNGVNWNYATPLTSGEVEKILATHKRLGL